MTWLWTLLGAFLFGVIGQNFASVFIGAALGWLAAQLLSLEKQVSALRDSIAQLRAELAARAKPETTEVPR
ncbi:hypothetical protein, partial [Salmonella enterica]|uniref:hypothetical protein n=1 Tax=Salmonella enterica TaxID=28901 RepID=UPI003299F98E